MRPANVLLMAAVLVLLPGSATISLASAPLDSVAPAMRRTAECIGVVLGKTGGVEGVKVSGTRDAYGFVAFVDYAFRQRGKLRRAKLTLSHEADEEGYYFYPSPLADVNGGPVTEAVQRIIPERCHAKAALEVK